MATEPAPSEKTPAGQAVPHLHRATRHGRRARDRDARLVFGTAASRAGARSHRGSEVGGSLRGPRAVDAARGTPLVSSAALEPRAPACAGAL